MAAAMVAVAIVGVFYPTGRTSLPEEPVEATDGSEQAATV
jgi:hypothetical protein